MPEKYFWEEERTISSNMAPFWGRNDTKGNVVGLMKNRDTVSKWWKLIARGECKPVIEEERNREVEFSTSAAKEFSQARGIATCCLSSPSLVGSNSNTGKSLSRLWNPVLLRCILVMKMVGRRLSIQYWCPGHLRCHLQWIVQWLMHCKTTFYYTKWLSRLSTR